jgi:predicted nucleic acid-binding protein
MLFAIDTSSLVALRRLTWLDLIQHQGLEFIWPSSVSKELLLRKGKNKEIFDLLADGSASESAIQRPLKIEEISQTDADVISLAAERQAVVVSDDALLRQQATKRGISAISLAALVRLLYQCSVFSKNEYLSRLRTLHDKKFLSKSEYRRLLQGIMP